MCLEHLLNTVSNNPLVYSLLEFCTLLYEFAFINKKFILVPWFYLQKT